MNLFYHRRLPARYCMLFFFFVTTLWLFFNILSSIYTSRKRLFPLLERRDDIGGNYGLGVSANADDPSFIGLVRSEEDKRIRYVGYNRHAFNELISNRIGFHRSVPDTRHEL